MAGIILGEKKDQSRIYTESGEWIPVTHIDTKSCYLIDIKEPKTHGYFALKLAFGAAKTIKKPAAGELKKAGITTPLRFLREIRLEKYKDKIQLIDENGKLGVKIGDVTLHVGDILSSEVLFQKGERVQISGTAKGKGFQGAMKRHGFSGGPKTHGQSDRWRAPGSIGQTTTPGRVMKGKRMAGRTGGKRITTEGLEIVEAHENGIIVKGLVPGPVGGLLEVRLHS